MKKNKKSIWGVEIMYPGKKPEPLEVSVVWDKKDAKEFLEWHIQSNFEDHKKDYKNDDDHLEWLKQIKTRVRKYALGEK